MTDPEITFLIQKTKTEGLTYEEKTKLYLLTSFNSNYRQVRGCRCYIDGDKCQCNDCKDYSNSVNCES